MFSMIWRIWGIHGCRSGCYHFYWHIFQHENHDPGNSLSPEHSKNEITSNLIHGDITDIFYRLQDATFANFLSLSNHTKPTFYGNYKWESLSRVTKACS